MSTLISFATSHIQQANWFLYKFQPTGLSDKLSIAVRIKSPVDIKTIETTLQALTERHAILRSIYYEEDGQIIQKIRDTADIYLAKIDASSWSDEELNEQLSQRIKLPFNLENGSIFRACLFTRSATDYILVLTLHQIAADWESLLILVDDLVGIYESTINCKPPNLLPINKSYRDYIHQEVEFINSVEGKQIGKYWRENLADDLPVLELPTTSPRPSMRTYDGAAIKFTINPELTQQLKQLVKTQGVTIEEILLAVFKVLLYRYTGEQDILVALLQKRANRLLFEQVVGNFNNVTVARQAISATIKFTDLLNQVRQQLFELDRYQNYPFSLLIQELKSYTLSHPPICQVAFGYSQLDKLFNAQEIDIEYYEIPQQKVDFELSLEVTDLQSYSLGYFKYNTDILEAETVAKIAEHFQNLLTAFVANPDTPVGKLPMLSDGEQQQIVLAWNKTQTDYPQNKSIHQLFESQVEKTPDAVAVVFEDQELTYSELNTKANQLAHYLQKLGIGPDVQVGICVERSLEMVVGLLGILKAGGAYVPLDSSYPSERLAYMLSDAKVAVLLTQESLVTSLPEYQGQMVCLDSDWDAIAQFSEENLSRVVKPKNLGYIIYTSGSTGKPKGVAMSQRALVNLIMWQQQEAIIGQGARTLQFSPISFDVSFQEIFSTWYSGGILVLISQEVRRDPLALMQFMAQKKIDKLFLPFVALQQLAAVAPQCQNLPQLREIVTAGEQLQVTPDLIELMNRLPYCRLQNQYGPSESHVVSAYTLQGAATSWPALPPIGRPIANNQLYILNSELQPVPIGVAGELYIGGVGVANGYHNRPELTAEKFIPDPFGEQGESRLYKTGDRARYLRDGNIEFLGRIDNQVKIRGFRIEIGEIEATLSQHPTVKETVVVVREDNPGNKRLVAYIVPETETTSNSELSDTQVNTEIAQQIIPQLKQHLNQKLAEYMVPSAFVVLSKLPLTPNGKVNRRSLPAPDLSSFSRSENFVAPRDSIEQKLAEIWSQLLNINPVGVKDNFFELGGHSLLAVSLMAKIQQHLDKQLPLSTLFTSPTIEDLANVVRQETKVSSSSLVPLQTQGTKPPFFCVHPAGGHVFYYLELSRYLGNDIPFYGLQVQGFNEGEKVFTKVEDMADFYIKNIRDFQPEGPYQIGGWSFGGVVAFEMAQQLVQQGQEVSLLALLDPWVPILLDPNKKIDKLYMRGVLSRYFGGMFGITNLVTEEEIIGLNSENQIEFIIDKAEKLELFPKEATREQNRRFIDVIIGTLKATYTYKRRPYPGKVTVFRAEEKHPHGIDPQLVWVEMYAILDVADMEVVMVPGNHFTFIQDPNLKVLAERLSSRV
ncbi:non-ribosomal peptide synthetase [Moorena producens PAL-8-15-08-1]|uniref:Non-ribosomal peptide synthetase n=1 Tax=Moorena producens PAL-8-15-08-1 TaxID=1458985 RepID=A0A1D8TTS4_9CYAN|nr:non-ribosomal peptide synthetase [Moorena producens]AOX00953.1 non-ribosomal peptide synthetase [Moorena producens PAL-8-15-08-1]